MLNVTLVKGGTYNRVDTATLFRLTINTTEFVTLMGEFWNAMSQPSPSNQAPSFSV